MAKRVGYRSLTVPFDECFYQPLQKIFSSVILFDYLKRMVEVGVTGMNREVIELVREKHPNYVLWAAFGEYYEIQESTFNSIRQEGTRVVGWFFDDEVRFDYYSKWWVPYVDYFVTNAMEAVPKYRELGAWVTHAIPDTGSALTQDWVDAKEKYDVSFIGSIQADRGQYIQALKSRGISIHLFGADWGRFVPYEEMIDIFRASKINLNFSKTYRNMKLGIKGRVFKVCLAGGFLLTEYVPGIEKYFEIDREIVCFRNPDEMIDKIIYYLSHDEARRAIARAGWERATSEYTSFHIVSRVFQEIEEDSNKDQRRALPQLKMPAGIRMRVSDYYFRWAVALSLENHRPWASELALAFSYFPFNVGAWYYYVVRFSPPWLRPALIKLYSIWEKLRRAVIRRLASVPYLSRVKRGIASRLFHT